MHVFHGAPDTHESPSTEFKPVEGEAEHYSGFGLMVEAYAAIWLIFFVWLVFLWRRASSLAARVDGLERAIARAGKQPEVRPESSP